MEFVVRKTRTKNKMLLIWSPFWLKQVNNLYMADIYHSHSTIISLPSIDATYNIKFITGERGTIHLNRITTQCYCSIVSSFIEDVFAIAIIKFQQKTDPKSFQRWNVYLSLGVETRVTNTFHLWHTYWKQFEWFRNFVSWQIDLLLPLPLPLSFVITFCDFCLNERIEQWRIYYYFIEYSIVISVVIT